MSPADVLSHYSTYYILDDTRPSRSCHSVHPRFQARPRLGPSGVTSTTYGIEHKWGQLTSGPRPKPKPRTARMRVAQHAPPSHEAGDGCRRLACAPRPPHSSLARLGASAPSYAHSRGHAVHVWRAALTNSPGRRSASGRGRARTTPPGQGGARAGPAARRRPSVSTCRPRTAATAGS